MVMFTCLAFDGKYPFWANLTYSNMLDSTVMLTVMNSVIFYFRPEISLFAKVGPTI